jgi:hypothetical protein
MVREKRMIKVFVGAKVKSVGLRRGYLPDDVEQMWGALGMNKGKNATNSKGRSQYGSPSGV